MHALPDCSEPPLQLCWSHMTSSYQWALNGSDELLGKDNEKPVCLIHFISSPLAEFVDVEIVEHQDGILRSLHGREPPSQDVQPH